MESNKEYLDKLVRDLFRLGDYSNWVAPKLLPNINWFEHNKCAYNNEDCLAKRLKELALWGADLSDKIYLISNINKVEPLKIALDYGGNPNLPGKNGILPIERAIYKKRTNICLELIKHKDFIFSSEHYSNINILISSINEGLNKISLKILDIAPNLLFENSTPSIPYFIALQLSKTNKKPNIHTLKILEKIFELSANKNIFYSPEESFNNKSIYQLCPEIAQYIIEKNYSIIKNNIEETSKHKETKLKI